MRLINRPLAFILAAAIATAAVLVIIEVIGFAAQHAPVVLPWTTWYRWAERTRWDQLVVQVWSGVFILVGAVLVVLELRRPRVTRLTLRPGGGTASGTASGTANGTANKATDAALTRRGLARSLGTAATGVDGISAAAVTVRRHRARISATADAHGRPAADALREPVTQALQDRLDQLELLHPPRLTVRVATNRKGS